MLNFKWDSNKAVINLKKHGISFYDACTAFSDPLSITIPDPLHSEEEDRFILIGLSNKNHLLVVVHTERDNNVHIISARRATKTERKNYESYG